MYLNLGGGTWHLVWKIEAQPDGILKLWVGSHQFVAKAGADAEAILARLRAQDPCQGRSLVWTEPEQEVQADVVSEEAKRAIAGRISYRCGGQ